MRQSFFLSILWIAWSNHLPLISQVLVPRLKDEPHAYTRFFNAPMQVHCHLSRRDKTEKSISMCSFLQASAATIHGAPAGPGSTAIAAARYKDKCVLEIVSIFCIENHLFDPCNPIRLAIPSPHWPTATVKPTRRWFTMCYSVRLGESIDLLKQLPKAKIWAMTTKRLIDCKAAFTLFAWASWSLVTWSDIGNVSDPHGGGD